MPKSRKRPQKKKNNKGKLRKDAVKFQKRGTAPDPIKMKFFEAKFDNSESITFQERLDYLRSIGQQAAASFPEKFKGIQEWFRKYDQIEALSFTFYYFMTSEAGYDEEAKTGELSFPPHYQELLQAFALTLPRNYELRSLAHEVTKFRSDLTEIGDLFKLMQFNFPETVNTENDLAIQQLRSEMRMHTAAVRNWSYDHTMQRVTLALADKVGKEFEILYGIQPRIFLTVLYKMTKVVEKRINDHRLKTIKVLRQKNHVGTFNTYEDCFPVEATDNLTRKDIWDKVGKNLLNLKEMLLTHSDLFLPAIFTFSYEELCDLSEGAITASKFKELMPIISFEFEDLADAEAEHFMLANPVHDAPFITLENNEGIFTTMWSVLTHHSIGLLEKFCARDEKLRKKYDNARSEYLENETYSLFKKSFPMAKIYQGSMWKGEDGKVFENDLLVVIGSFALVIEAKSGKVTAPAKRGAPDRLFRTLRELIEEPSEQALRFIEYLKENPKELSLAVKKGPNNKINAEGIKYFIPLGVTLSHLGMTSSNLKQLINSGVTTKTIEELAPSINLTDLELVFDILPFAAQKIHYLQRRRELEAKIQYMGDEADLLAWYLDEGFSLGAKESMYGFFNVSLKSKELDNYFIGTANNEKVTKPSLRMTKWWKDMVTRLEEKQLSMWAENSYILFNIPIDAQMKFEKLINKLKAKVVAGKAEFRHNWIAMASSEEERQFYICGYCYQSQVRDERDTIMSNILSDSGMDQAKGKLVIGINIDEEHYPYSVLGCYLMSELFDSKFIGMVR